MLEIIREQSRPDQQIFVGVTDPISQRVETVDEVRERVLEAAEFIPPERLGTTDDCGFSPFGDDTSTSRETAFAKISARVEGTVAAALALGCQRSAGRSGWPQLGSGTALGQRAQVLASRPAPGGLCVLSHRPGTVVGQPSLEGGVIDPAKPLELAVEGRQPGTGSAPGLYSQQIVEGEPGWCRGRSRPSGRRPSGLS